MKKKILYSTLFIFIACLAISVFVLWKASKPEYDIRKDAEAFALETKALAIVNDSYAYNGNIRT